MSFLSRNNTHYCESKAPGRGTGPDNQEDVHHGKRTPSSPHGAPQKRSAFNDLTNTKKVQNDAQVKNLKLVKKTQRNKVVMKNKNTLNVSKYLTPEEHHVDHVDQPEQVDCVDQTELSTSADTGTSHPVEQPAVQEQQIPEEFDVDHEHVGDCLMSPEYAKDIFDYLRYREENFELNHETLYLAVKVTDHYLSVTEVMRESLQLIGSTAMLLAAKFEERSPPTINDFLYICDDAYQRQEFLVMERNILQELDFDINIPVPYRFLRRYAKVAHASMETLTLARYVCELSLMELELVPERASHLASACLLLALITARLGGWTAALQYHSGYTLRELGPLVRKLYAMLASPADENLRAVENKYSHKVFYEVAKMSLVHIETLEEALCDVNLTP
ncbi:G2/mitotic-specific cyclin-B3-like isoform X2 [Silurus meridionalis]|uniref:G2/mitotic-specific cyclin-B3-like isoform X2 n=1 Tax=Silurus meridionalis TaxID=175797 RepID=UPI001EEC460C|nr:G2/mitotic-specific cyclin-B3-like isoform X2 [Silurus meridionalis]